MDVIGTKLNVYVKRCFYVDVKIYVSVSKRLKLPHYGKCKCVEYACSYAALNGHLEYLKYAHKNGCGWDYMTCAFVASNGHLDCLEYAHKKWLRLEHIYMFRSSVGRLFKLFKICT